MLYDCVNVVWACVNVKIALSKAWLLTYCVLCRLYSCVRDWMFTLMRSVLEGSINYRGILSWWRGITGLWLLEGSLDSVGHCQVSGPEGKVVQVPWVCTSYGIFAPLIQYLSGEIQLEGFWMVFPRLTVVRWKQPIVQVMFGLYAQGQVSYACRIWWQKGYVDWPTPSIDLGYSIDFNY